MARSKPIKASEGALDLKRDYEAVSTRVSVTQSPPSIETICAPLWSNGASTFTAPGASTLDLDFDIISIVKEELKHNIHRRRQEKGLGDINSDVHVSRSNQLTETEQMKRQQKRERNRIAAAKCREKKRLLTIQIIQETDTLEQSNRDLQKQAEKLKTEKAYLQEMLKQHLMICPKRQQQDRM